MKKKILSLILASAMCLSLAVPALALPENNDQFRTTFWDSSGIRYEIGITYSNNETEVKQYDELGNVISVSTVNIDTGEICTYTMSTPLKVSALGGKKQNVTHSNVTDYILSASEQRHTSRGYDGSFYDPTYVLVETMNTDYRYRGDILTGRCYKQYTGNYVQSQQINHTYASGLAVTTVLASLSVTLKSPKLAAITLSVMESVGVSVLNDCILGNFNPITTTKTYDVNYQITMKPENSYIVMAKTSGSIPFGYIKGDGAHDFTQFVNSSSYTSENQALYAGYTEALGYAAQAFEAKYITGTRPNLILPVSGPSYTWQG